MKRYTRQAMNDKVLQEIRGALAETDHCLFIEGSRLAVDGTAEDEPKPANWGDSLRAMLHWCVEAELCEPDEIPPFDHLLQCGMHQDAGQELQDLLTDSSQRLLCVTATAGDRGVMDIHRTVVKCDFGAYLSMTLDQSVENAYAVEMGERLTKRFASDRMSDVVQRLRTEGTPFLLKLRGDTSNGPSIHLNPGHPTATAVTSADCQAALDLLTASFPALLVGFSTTEPELQALLDRIAAFRRTDGAPKRWLLLPAGEVPALKAKRLTLDYGITVLEYQPGELPSFMAALAADEPLPVAAPLGAKPSVRDMLPALMPEPAAGFPFEMEAMSAPLARKTRKKAPLLVFTAYSHADARQRKELDGHFRAMVDDGLIQIWYDHEILAGEEWNQTIADKLIKADLILLLFSNHFFDSKYCREIELRRALERHEAGDARAIGIMVTDVDVNERIRRLQLLPRDEAGKRVTLGENRYPHRTRRKVADEIRRIAESLVGAPSKQ